MMNLEISKPSENVASLHSSKMSAKLTSDEQLKDILVHGDNSIELVMYVDEVLAPAEVGKVVKYQLFKFVLSNGSKKLMCLIWNKGLIQKYLDDVRIGRIMHIDGAQCKATTYNDHRNLLPFELTIQSNTEVSYEGMYESVNLSDTAEVVQCKISDIYSAPCSLLKIEAFVKTAFTVTNSKNGKMSCGIGAITDGNCKINVQISKFESNDFKKGQSVTVIGTLMDKDGPPTILCEDMSCIVRNQNIQNMSIDQVMNGIKTPKRPHSD